MGIQKDVLRVRTRLKKSTCNNTTNRRRSGGVDHLRDIPHTRPLQQRSFPSSLTLSRSMYVFFFADTTFYCVNTAFLLSQLRITDIFSTIQRLVDQSPHHFINHNQQKKNAWRTSMEFPGSVVDRTFLRCIWNTTFQTIYTTRKLLE